MLSLSLLPRSSKVKIYQITQKCAQMSLKFWQMLRISSKIWPMTLIFLPKWRNFAKSGHTATDCIFSIKQPNLLLKGYATPSTKPKHSSSLWHTYLLYPNTSKDSLSLSTAEFFLLIVESKIQRSKENDSNEIGENSTTPPFNYFRSTFSLLQLLDLFAEFNLYALSTLLLTVTR